MTDMAKKTSSTQIKYLLSLKVLLNNKSYLKMKLTYLTYFKMLNGLRIHMAIFKKI